MANQRRSGNKQKYEIFINHRGKDVKRTVASLLYHNLTNKKLSVFLDNKELQLGDIIQVKLRQVIDMASVHIAVFSENYAESIWCLEELCLMVESGARGALIIPIFYQVKPSVLRMNNDEGVYSRALQKHLSSGRVDMATVDKWIHALRDVSYTYGFQFEGDHGMLLEKIAARVMSHIDAKRKFETGIWCSAVIWILIGMAIRVFVNLSKY